APSPTEPNGDDLASRSRICVSASGDDDVGREIGTPRTVPDAYSPTPSPRPASSATSDAPTAMANSSSSGSTCEAPSCGTAMSRNTATRSVAVGSNWRTSRAPVRAEALQSTWRRGSPARYSRTPETRLGSPGSGTRARWLPRGTPEAMPAGWRSKILGYTRSWACDDV